MNGRDAAMCASRRHDDAGTTNGVQTFNLYHLSAIYLEIPSLGAYVKLRRATTCFVMSVRPSVRPRGTPRLSMDGFL